MRNASAQKKGCWLMSQFRYSLLRCSSHVYAVRCCSTEVIQLVMNYCIRVLVVCQGLTQGNIRDGRSAADKRRQSNMQHLEREAAEWNRSRCRRATVLSDCCSSFLRTSERDIRCLHAFAARNTEPTAFGRAGNRINVYSEVTEQIKTKHWKKEIFHEHFDLNAPQM